MINAVSFSGVDYFIVDLDGTLIDGDTTAMMIRDSLKANPLHLLRASFSLLKGRLAFKSALADLRQETFGKLSCRQEVLNLIHQARKQQVTTYLVSAAPHKIVTEIASDLNIFDGAWGSQDVNLKGTSKLNSIRKKIGTSPFAYAGDSLTDIEIWDAAQLAIIVHGNKRVVNQARSLNCEVHHI